MNNFNEYNTSADDLWKWHLKEYENKNPFIRFLLNNYFKQVKKIIDHLDQKDTILEIGCGCGASSLRITKMLKGQYFEASEYDERLVLKLKELGLPFKISQESIYCLSRNDSSFDHLFILEVLEHLDDVDLALKQIFRVARKYVVISVPFEPIFSFGNMLRGKYWKMFGNTPGHKNHYTPAGLKKTISKFGRVAKIYMPLPWIIFLVEKI